MRDAKINDIYQGTGEIDERIVARRILDDPSSVLRQPGPARISHQLATAAADSTASS
jgi:hypothetical protein